jgi:peptidoglycan hydrolase-like protein with peptidoglycan-binding domain
MIADAPARKRILAGHERGLDVQGLQRALRKALEPDAANVRDGIYDLRTKRDVSAFQRSRGIVATGSVGQPTLNALWPAFDHYGRSLYYRARVGAAPRLPSAQLKKGASGDRVRAAQQMLWRALGDASVNLRNGVYGAGMTADVRTFLFRCDLKGDGELLTQAVWEMLYGFADAYAREVASGAAHPSAILRSNLVTWAEWYVGQRGSRYVQARPYQRDVPPVLPLRNDCSGSVSHLFRLAGLPDPSGRDYSGSGYTGTMMHAGHRVTMPRTGSSGLLPADLILYGGSSGSGPSHIGVMLDAGRLFTFGGNPPTIIAYARYWPSGRRYDIGARRVIA